MHEHYWLGERFEAHRAHLRAVAYRMLARAATRTTPFRKPGYGSAALTRAASRT